MIEWLDRIPDSMAGVLVASALWLGFNYVVLAPRAMERQQVATTIPSCADALERRQQRLQIPGIGLGDTLGLPELRALEQRLRDLAMPRPLSSAERTGRCTCAAKRAEAAMRFDYTIHTASFRLVEPQAIAGVVDSVIDVAVSNVCGIPALSGVR
ncbi:hypothetical protein [Siccirubricoccus phaeus]|uniref:hypothetical protein n=1 Tax=Siccirubricoccus phaeus TaxID=2595053 RepID=UPI0011F3AA34|nr:hypothetical protein [Siccirubricoccus phaeus]